MSAPEPKLREASRHIDGSILAQYSLQRLPVQPGVDVGRTDGWTNSIEFTESPVTGKRALQASMEVTPLVPATGLPKQWSHGSRLDHQGVALSAVRGRPNVRHDRHRSRAVRIGRARVSRCTCDTCGLVGSHRRSVGRCGTFSSRLDAELSIHHDVSLGRAAISVSRSPKPPLPSFWLVCRTARRRQVRKSNVRHGLFQ